MSWKLWGFRYCPLARESGSAISGDARGADRLDQEPFARLARPILQLAVFHYKLSSLASLRATVLVLS
jgi:hypothetical protein